MKIQITIESREDGGLRVYSDDLPGFVLSHSDSERVIGDISPALLEIMKYLSEDISGPNCQFEKELGRGRAERHLQE